MKVRALASLSGPMGRKVLGDEFLVSADQGRELVARGLAQEVPAAADLADAADPVEIPTKPRKS
ncbi:hypothetical protein [Pseudomonas sp. SG-MS2]|uniref:hypothetical protein n=1 Tax=Pseudomonas sp. SG-MS2 TaxID=1914534 RepID=UPI00143D2A65|nr:hypothetical protein [Pseudomonas sp. SG-MS2]